MFRYIKSMLVKRKQQKDAAFLENIKTKIAAADDDVLKEMDQDFHHSMEADRKIGHMKPDPVLIRASKLIGEELHKRNLKTCDDIEEDIWFSQRGQHA